MEVIILAGGLGTRLQSVVNKVPKCMAPVNEKPFLWYLLKFLSQYNVSHVVLSVGYLREIIFEWIDKIEHEFPFKIDYAIEETPLGTGGGIRLALEKVLSKNVIILNGDTFFDINIEILLREHEKNNSPLTIALKEMTNFDRYGSVECNNGKIIAFHEKKFCKKGLINGGIYAVNKEKLDMSNLPEKFSFETDIMEKQCSIQNLYGITSDGYFIDIGIPSDYERANMEFKDLF